MPVGLGDHLSRSWGQSGGGVGFSYHRGVWVNRAPSLTIQDRRDSSEGREEEDKSSPVVAFSS